MFGFLRESAAVRKLIDTHYSVIFFSESAYYFQYFRHLVEAVRGSAIKSCYITADRNDPLLNASDDNFEVVYCKDSLGFVFPKLKADVMLMTMPDLQQFLFRRSASVREYVYVFHALVSTTQQYRAGAFDHYDSILLAGPHQEKEIREAEKISGLPRKNLVPYGYPLLQDLTLQAKTLPSQRQILIAPSWYENGILQTCLPQLLDVLLAHNLPVIIRPHPEFRKRNRKGFAKLQDIIKKNPLLSIDNELSVWPTMLGSDFLITDRSGIAFEYAFVQKRKVIFIDTPLKIQNPDFARFENVPAENMFRNEIGICVQPDRLSSVDDALSKTEDPIAMQTRIEAVQKAMLFDAGFNPNGPDYIRSLVG